LILLESDHTLNSQTKDGDFKIGEVNFKS